MSTTGRPATGYELNMTPAGRSAQDYGVGGMTSSSSGRPAQGYELVMAVTMASFVAHNLYMPMQVMKARKKYGIEYPTMYATKDDCKSVEDAKTFNCIQRGHQNSLEYQAPFLVLLNLAGLQHPMTAAAAGAAFIAGRLLYFHGYSTGQPKARTIGGPLYMGAMATVLVIIGKTVYLWASKKNN
eukprot:jgi/Ulvmu1/7457/UM036_0121.1